MSPSTPSPATVLDVIDGLDPPGTPVTTAEVAEQFDCSARTVYNRLDSLVDDGELRTKKVGARGRVWWRPVADRQKPTDVARDLPPVGSGSADPTESGAANPAEIGTADPTEQAALLEEVLSAIIDLHGADFGTIQLYDPESQSLSIAVERGFPQSFLDHFAVVDAADDSACGRALRQGDRIIIEDVQTDPAFEPHRSVAAEAGYRAVQSTPMVGTTGDPLGMVSTYFSEVHRPSDAELRLTDVYVRQAAGMIERLRAETALRESEDRYRVLFEEMDEGFALNRLVRDADGRTCDVIYVELNAAFEKLTGVSRADAEGRAASELFPGQDQSFFETFGRVAESGESAQVENYVPANDRWYDVRIFPREADVVAVLYTDITDRKRLEQQLRTEKEQLDVAVANSPLVLFRLDTDLRYTWVKNPDEGVGAVDFLGKRDDEFLPPETAETIMEPKRTVLETGEPMRGELSFELPGGNVTYDHTFAPLRDESGEIVGLTCAAFDITEQKRTQRSLERLNAATRELIDASPAEISASVADLTRRILGVEHAALWRYDETDGELRAFDTSTDPEADPETIRLPEGFSERVWETFIGDELTVETGHPPTDSTAASSMGRWLFVPLRKHGVICVCSTGGGEIDPRIVELTETVAATVETAWNRAEGEQRLARQNEELERFDRLYSLVWRIDQALVRAETVADIDAAVCERLADSALYEFAWIGEYDATTDAVKPRAWAGVDSSYLDAVTAATADTQSASDLFAATVRTKTLQTVPDIATDTRSTAWRETTLERGARSCLSIPLVYDGSVYGVLTVYKPTPRPDAYDRDVLAALGRTVGHAINAVETRATIQADSVAELTLQSVAAETPLCRLSRTTDCVIEFEGVVPGTDGTTTVFFTATGASPDELIAAAEQTVAIEELVDLADRENGTVFEARLTEPSLALLFIEHQATVHGLTVKSGTATAVVGVPESADVRAFVEAIQSVLTDLELLARRPRTEAPETILTLRTAFEDRLTPRQQEVLQLAYRSGFFESPRLRTGRELAETLDISQSTFNYHLRGAERTLCEVVFDLNSSS